MCGRATNQLRAERLAQLMGLDLSDSELWEPNYNIAPTQAIPVAGLRDGRRVLRVMRWGLVPSWASDRTIGPRCINARAETVAERPAFKAAFKKRRCVVLVTGWYEWLTEGKVKRPHWFHGAREEVLPLAGLWERWEDPTTGEELRTCSVVTCAPNELAATIHDRMPVVLEPGAIDAWMRAETRADELHAMLRPCAEDRLGVHEVDRRVGKVAENDERLIARAA